MVKQAQNFWDEFIEGYFGTHKNGTIKSVITWIESDPTRLITFGRKFGIYSQISQKDKGDTMIKLHQTSASFHNRIKKFDWIKASGFRGNLINYESERLDG